MKRTRPIAQDLGLVSEDPDDLTGEQPEDDADTEVGGELARGGAADRDEASEDRADSESTVEVADTVGSGDAFLAGLLYSLIQGVGPPEAIEFASAMGALIASYSGPCPEYSRQTIYAIINNQQL